MFEKLQATLNNYMPTTTDKGRYSFNKEHLDDYLKLWTWKSNDEINARRRARYAERKKAWLMMAIAGELAIESLTF